MARTATQRAALWELARRRWWRNPDLYAKERLGLTLTPDQVAVMHSVRDNRKTYAKAGNGVGKTFIASVVVVWFMECAPRVLPDGTPTGPIAYTSAPTSDQVTNLLWKEIRLRHAAANPAFPGRLLDVYPRWNLDVGSFALGKVAKDEEGFKGQHAPYFLIVLDEGPGVPEYVYRAASTMLKGRFARLLTIGNPTTTAGEFHDAFHSRSAVNSTLTIAAKTHPNVVAALDHLGVSWEEWRDAPYGQHQLPDDWDDPIQGAVSLIDLDEAKVEWGVGTPQWQAAVEGEFPSGSDRNLVALEWLDRARHRDDDHHTHGPLPSRLGPPTGKWAGLDIARFGSDRSVLVLMDGQRVESIDMWTGYELSHTAGKALAAIRQGYTLNYDEGGLGAGITSHLKERGVEIGMQAHENNAGRSPTEDARAHFPKMRDQLWGDAADFLRAGYIDLRELPEDQYRKLRAELTAVEYELDSASRKRVESKDQLKKRIGKSPDVADAFNLALHRPVKGRRLWVSGMDDELAAINREDAARAELGDDFDDGAGAW